MRHVIVLCLILLIGCAPEGPVCGPACGSPDPAAPAGGPDMGGPGTDDLLPPEPGLAEAVPPFSPLAGGVWVTLRGGPFSEGTAVSFAGVPATELNLVSPRDLAVRVPPRAGSPGRVALEVRFPGGARVWREDLFRYFAYSDRLDFAPKTMIPADSLAVVKGVDLNRDGRGDLVLGLGVVPLVKVMLGTGDGTFQTPSTFPTLGDTWSITAGDLNNDGVPDVVVAGQAITVLLGNNDGTLQTPRYYDAGLRPYGVIIADLDGDGKADVAVANHYSDNVSVLRGRGDGTLYPKQDFNAGLTPTAIGAADLNGDRKLDLLVTNRTSGDILIYLGKGDGTFQAPRAMVVGRGPFSFATEDLDMDGKLDLVVGDSDGTSVVTYLGNGDGSFRMLDRMTGWRWSDARVVDLNGDGLMDVAVNEDLRLGVLLGRGDGTFDPARYFATGSLAAFDAVDVDGDGRLDIVGAAGSVVLLRNTTM